MPNKNHSLEIPKHEDVPNSNPFGKKQEGANLSPNYHPKPVMKEDSFDKNF